jgi:hypothetical protein
MEDLVMAKEEYAPVEEAVVDEIDDDHDENDSEELKTAKSTKIGF